MISDFENELAAFMTLREFNYQVNISLKHKYVYLEVAKAACSTIKKRLIDYEVAPLSYGDRKIHTDNFSSPFVKPFQLDSTALQHILFSGEFYRFSFVRNPYARVLSAYLDKIVQHKPQVRKVLRILGLPDDDDAVAGTDLTFEQFVESIENTPLKSLDHHWRPQYLQLMHPLLKLDFIGKVESFEDDWSEVASRIGLSGDAGENVLWHQTGARKKFKQYYNFGLQERVRIVYRKDFEIYGYETITGM